MIKLKKVADEIEYNGVKGSLKEFLQKTKVDGKRVFVGVEKGQE